MGAILEVFFSDEDYQEQKFVLAKIKFQGTSQLEISESLKNVQNETKENRIIALLRCAISKLLYKNF